MGENKICIVFDIDGTVITRDGDAIEPMLELCKYIRQQNIPCFFCTARAYSKAGEKETKLELDEAGYKNLYEGLVMAPRKVHESTDAVVAKWKLAQRQSLLRVTSLVPIMNIGNEWRDIDNSLRRRSSKRFYIIQMPDGTVSIKLPYRPIQEVESESD